MARTISRIHPASGSAGRSSRTQPAADALPIYGAAASEQKQKPRKGGGDPEEGGKESGAQKLAKKGEELKDEMDSLMDEIDSVLEENAEEFVKNYVQRGGE